MTRLEYPRSLPLTSVKQPRSLSLTSVKPRLFNPALFALLALVLTSLASTAAPALAAAPEAPGPVTVESVTASSANLRGVLNPAAEGEAGTYEFLYRESPTECKGGSVSKRGLSFGVAGEEVREGSSGIPFSSTEPPFVPGLTGLTPHTTYTVCLLARNLAGETTVGPATTFKTAIPLETPETEAANPVTATTAVFHGVLNPAGERKEEPGAYEFIYKQSVGECEITPAERSQGVQQQHVSGATPPVGNEREDEFAEASNLLPGTAYTFCLLASDGNEAQETARGPPVTFKTLAQAPEVAGESSAGVRAATATLSAEIDPGGAPTGYRVQYVTAARYKEAGFAGAGEAPAPPAAEASAGSAGTTVTVHQELSGLQAGSEYDFRFVARNGVGPVGEGAVETFTTLGSESVGLPDGRVYEKVTPSENNDADTYVPFNISNQLVNSAGEFQTHLPFEVAENGEAVAYVAAPTVEGTGNGGLGRGDEYLAHRSSMGRWERPLNLQPLGENKSVVNSAFYQAFSPNLNVGILQSGSYREPEATPAPSSQAPNGGYSVLYRHVLESKIYQPFFLSPPSNRSPEAFQTANLLDISVLAPHELGFAGASADWEHLLFEANGVFAGMAAAEGNANENNLYESIKGQLSLVNVLPNGETEANATFGAPPLSEEQEPPSDFSNAISSDGSRIFWTALEGQYTPKALYVSEGVGGSGERTVQVDASQVAGGKGGGGRFWTASKDGSRVFFGDSDANDLTADTGAGSGENLYVYEVNPVAGEPGRLTDLTYAAHVELEGVLGEGETEGKYTLYFVAKGVLAQNQNSNGVQAKEGADNLYMLEEGAKPVFIAALSPRDGNEAIPPVSIENGEVGDWAPGVGHRTAEVTPDGESVVFMSNNQKFDGHYEEAFQGHSRKKLEEVYVFDARTGVLSCASCARDGLKAEENLEARVWLGGFLPVSDALTYQPTVISGDGSRVFFDSGEPLVSDDTNGEQDVYEWERDGSGGCGESDGCVYLLSSGAGSTSSFLIGTDATGNNVFFVTRAQLVPEDKNENYDLYDARVDGRQPVLPSACSGTGCQGVPSAPPVFATPPTGTYEGVGDFSPAVPAVVKTKPKTKIVKCKKDFVKKKDRCVRRKSGKKAKKSNRIGK